ncbi:MAG TPA: hydrogenase expression/formation protein HypE [Pirellulales bacterium]|jgi:hydrogenase expression/formation protein HypE|nr:hydrogenase expression/formation protein HypE [Pirellulales bacterium]
MATAARPVVFHDKQIAMAHGAGGEASRRLIEGLIQPAFANPFLDGLADAAVLAPQAGRLALTTDSFVVQPLQFPGGSIGELAVNGTVNDLAVSGAAPIALSAALILEAGLTAEVLRREIAAMAAAAARAGVSIVTGDTKVVEHGKADGMYITTTGLGLLDPRAELQVQRVEPGDRIFLSGPIGSHGMAVMLARAELDIEADIRSDTRPLGCFTSALLEAAGSGVRWMRDATRGGVATVLNELARDADLTLVLEEDAIPVEDAVRGACELLGLDPLQVANEGQFVAILAADVADAALAAVRGIAGGERACLVGEVRRDRYSRVVAHSAYGGARVIDMLIGDPLPRIC